MTPIRARGAVLVLVLAFLAVVSTALLRQIPDERDVPIAPLSMTGGPQLTPVPVLTSQGGIVTRSIDFVVADRAQLTSADQIRLVVDGYSLRSRMTQAWLDLDRGSCRFSASARTLNAATVLVLARDGVCEASPGAGRASLTARFDATLAADAKLALHTYITGTRPDLITTDGTDRATPVGHLTYRHSARSERAATLLAWMWNLPESWLWIRLAAAGSILLIGAWFAVDGTAARIAGISSFCLACGLGLVYGCVAPPLQAADEPDHLLSLAALVGRADLPASEAALARRVHFDRIAFRARERFTPASRDTPWARAWVDTEVFAEDVANRSSTATRYWRALSPLLPQDPAHALLFVRTSNAVVFALALGAGAAVLAASGAAAAMSLTLVLLSVPALSFFGTQLSENTWTVFAFVLVAYACVTVIGHPNATPVAALLGVALALIFSGSRSGWPMGSVIVMACAVRVLTANAAKEETLRFWSLIALPSIVLIGSGLLHVPSPAYNQWHLSGLDPAAPFNSGTLLVGTVGGSLAGYGLERLRPRVAGIDRAIAWCRYLALGLAGWFAFTLVASTIVPMPGIPWLEGNTTMGLGEYVRHALASAATIARVGHTDYFVWGSFLAGFGWLDVFLPDGVIAGLTIAASIVAIVTVLALARQRDGRRSAGLLLILSGVLLSIAGSAVGAFAMNRNLHGRYLLGPHLVGIAVLCGGLALLPPRRLAASTRAALLLCALFAVHGVAAWVIVRRYFG